MLGSFFGRIAERVTVTKPTAFQDLAVRVVCALSVAMINPGPRGRKLPKLGSTPKLEDRGIMGL